MKEYARFLWRCSRIAFLGSWAKFYLFNLDLLLLLLRGMAFLVLLKHKFAVVHNSANWWLRLRSNFHQVQVRFFCKAFCLYN